MNRNRIFIFQSLMGINFMEKDFIMRPYGMVLNILQIGVNGRS